MVFESCARTTSGLSRDGSALEPTNLVQARCRQICEALAHMFAAEGYADAVRPLVSLQLEVLLTRDCEGRLVGTRDPARRAAPRLFVGRSSEQNVWATRRGLEAELARELHSLCAAEPELDEPTPAATPRCRERVLELLAPIVEEYRGPCFVLPDDMPTDPRARLVTREERARWLDRFPWLEEEFDAVTPVAVAFEGDEAAAVCHSPRGMTDAAAEAGVETLAAFRNRGLATAAVACWAQAVRSGGRLALYSSSWENSASLAVARRLSARPYGENWHVS